jgi:hypothetical protein
MSATEVPESAPPEDLKCGPCGQPIQSTYFKAGARVVCPTCRPKLEAAVAAGGELRFLRALGFGLGASVIGGLLWYAIRQASGYELGIVAVGVGLLVGMAVKTGSQGRGGIGYQIMAVLLTYLTVCGSWLPLILEQAHKTNGAGGMLVSLLAVGIALIIPFKLDALSMLIVGFALWEAWKINIAPPPLKFEGPFQRGEQPAVSPTPSPPA